MPEPAMRPRAGSSAKAVLLTALGEYVLPHAGAVWTSTVVRSLGALGIEERNARQALARLADQGVVRSQRNGRRARWHLTDAGRVLLTTGTERIYGFGGSDDAWDGRWLVVLCSVPEEQRAKRHQLRSQLGFGGFGFLAPGVALSPHLDREALADQVLEDLGLVPGAVVFRAEAGRLASTEELLARGWDLDALAARYDEFLRAFARRAPRSPEARFVALTELVHAWRHFPFIDPEIPLRLLPARWPGRRAKALFDDRHAAWAPDANGWYEALDGPPGRQAAGSRGVSDDRA
jgi:phenylacetic acid degradation operon negative regulatory protein